MQSLTTKTFYAMKKTILSILLLVAFMPLTAAQPDSVIRDTVTHRYERFYYNSWYDTCPYFLDSGMVITTHVFGRVYHSNRFYTPHPIAVKGLAATVLMEEDLPPINPAFEWYYSPDHGFQPEFLTLWQDTGWAFGLLAAPLRVDTAIPRVIRIPLSGRDTSRHILCYLYEVYFDKPVIVDSIFAVGGTDNSLSLVYSEEYHTTFIYWKRWNYAIVTDKTILGPEDMVNYCQNPYPAIGINSETGRYSTHDSPEREWGPLFAIVDFYNLDVQSSDSLRGSVQGGGRFSDQTHVSFSASPEPGFYLRRWSDGDTHLHRTILLTQDTLFTAHFTDSIPFTVSAQPDRMFQGHVTGGGTYWLNDTAHLSAIPNERYRFIGWDDGDTANPRSAVITQDTAFTALFEWDDQHEGIAVPGKDEEGQQLFTLTPNPAHGSVTVTLAVQPSNATLTLADASGRELLTLKATAPTLAIPLAPYPAGTYFLTLRTPDAASTQRLVVK